MYGTMETADESFAINQVYISTQSLIIPKRMLRFNMRDNWWFKFTWKKTKS